MKYVLQSAEIEPVLWLRVQASRFSQLVPRPYPEPKPRLQPKLTLSSWADAGAAAVATVATAGNDVSPYRRKRADEGLSVGVSAAEGWRQAPPLTFLTLSLSCALSPSSSFREFRLSLGTPQRDDGGQSCLPLAFATATRRAATTARSPRVFVCVCIFVRSCARARDRAVSPTWPPMPAWRSSLGFGSCCQGSKRVNLEARLPRKRSGAQTRRRSGGGGASLSLR